MAGKKCFGIKMLKVLALLLCTSVRGFQPRCNKQTTLKIIQDSSYAFSIRLLDRVSQETRGSFVFSPVYTWLQVLSLSEGAHGKTLKEFTKVAKLKTNRCFRGQIWKIFNSVDEELNTVAKHSSIIVINKPLDVKEAFKTKVEQLRATKVLSLNFYNNKQSADKVNAVIGKDTDGVITEGVYPIDFNNTRLLMIDTAYFKADWRSPFNPVYTKREPFYSYDKVQIGEANIMQQVGFFNFTNVPSLGAQALELQFDDRFTMIFLLPNEGRADDLFWPMHNITFMAIFDLFRSEGLKLVNVKVPRFKLTNKIDNIPELLLDMGLQTVFSPRSSNLKRMSDNKVFVSLMSQVVDIEVTETGAVGKAVPEPLIASNKPTDFVLNRPFAYFVVDRVTEAIFFGGTYSNPVLF